MQPASFLLFSCTLSSPLPSKFRSGLYFKFRAYKCYHFEEMFLKKYDRDIYCLTDDAQISLDNLQMLVLLFLNCRLFSFFPKIISKGKIFDYFHLSRMSMTFFGLEFFNVFLSLRFQKFSLSMPSLFCSLPISSSSNLDLLTHTILVSEFRACPFQKKMHQKSITFLLHEQTIQVSRFLQAKTLFFSFEERSGFS